MTTILNGKSIILGVTGSIAAFKAADLASKLTQAGTSVDVVLTRSAQEFVSVATFAGLTPILLERSMQAQFIKPMVVSLAFGVVFATFVILLIVPTGYLALFDLKCLLLGRPRADVTECADLDGRQSELDAAP